MSKPGSGPSQIRDVKWHRLGILEGALGAAKSTQAAVAAEREECAKLVEGADLSDLRLGAMTKTRTRAFRLIAAAIRARGVK